MSESQLIEYKESWRDEYLKWICASFACQNSFSKTRSGLRRFANAQGGVLYIGKRDDGSVCGVADSKQLLQGSALTNFLLRKTGKNWDSVPLENVSVDDLDKESFDIFHREAIRSGRMSKDDLKLSNQDLLEKLNLLDGTMLKRAAVLLFHRNPEKWITGSFVKIGFFETDADLRYQDEVHGSLMIQADRVIDLLYTKYLTAEISYDNITRIEHYPFPKDAVREAVFNALIHQDFSVGVPVQISVSKDKLYISNDCVFPANWTADTLMQKHRSLPHNPDIANTFFRAGFIESWGRGIEKICNLCKEYGIAEPEYTVHPNDIMMMFKANEPVNEPVKLVLAVIADNPNLSKEKIAEKIGMSRATVTRALAKLVEIGAIKRVGSDKSGHWEILENGE